MSKSNGDGSGSGSIGNKKPVSRLDHFLYSGDKKHVVAGILIVAAIGAIPWLLFTRDAKHQSHEDYIEKAKQAEKARQSRLSSSSTS